MHMSVYEYISAQYTLISINTYTYTDSYAVHILKHTHILIHILIHFHRLTCYRFLLTGEVRPAGAAEHEQAGRVCIKPTLYIL
jgi:hypothetical protein